jgi:hypothetical protein
MSLKREKKNLANPDEYLKIELISQTHNLWNLRFFGLNQIAKFLVNLMWDVCFEISK